MRHHRLTWTEAGQLTLGEAGYLVELVEQANKQSKSQARTAKRHRGKGQPGTRLEPIMD